MVGALVFGGIGLVALVWGVVLCTGRGAKSVAGINTMESEELAKYDVPKICRATGLLMLVCAAACGAMAVPMCLVGVGKMGEGDLIPFIVVFAAVVVVGCAVLIWYANRRCFKKGPEIRDS